MKLTVLMENTAKLPNLEAQHGLSLYIEYGGRRLIMDTGADGAFARNAEKLGVDISKVDFCVVSHNHNDHAGGLADFLAVNDHAKVYMREESLRGSYSINSGECRDIGFDRALLERYPERFVFTSGVTELFDGCTLFGDFPRNDFYGVRDPGLRMTDEAHGLTPEDFRHEQAMELDFGDDGMCVISGCCHSGAGNIIDRARELFPRRRLLSFVGGLHLFRLTDEEPIERLAKRLDKDIEGCLLTGHCTGVPAYEQIAGLLGQKLGQLTGGETFVL